MANRIKDYLFKNKTDGEFTSLSLPRKRKDVFFRLFRYSFGKLIMLSLFTTIFFVLTFVWRVVFDTFLLKLDSGSEDYFNRFFTLNVYYSLPIRLFSNAIAFLGLAGLFYSIRILCWGMPYKLTYTFFRGIKLSYKEYLFGSLIYTVASTLYTLSFKYYSLHLFDNILVNILMYSLLVISIIIVLMMLMYSLTMSSLYNMKFTTKVKYCFILSIKYYFKNLGILCLSLAIFMVPFIIKNVLFELVSIGLLVLIGFVYITLIVVLYTNSIYDIHINKSDYDEYYRKGLYRGDIDA